MVITSNTWNITHNPDIYHNGSVPEKSIYLKRQKRVGIMKAKRKWNDEGIATFLGISAFYWVLATAGIVVGVVAWNVTQRPDVSWFLIIGIIAVAIFFIIFMGRKKPTKKEYVYVREPQK